MFYDLMNFIPDVIAATVRRLAEEWFILAAFEKKSKKIKVLQFCRKAFKSIFLTTLKSC